MTESVVLAVGQEIHLKRGKDRIVYAGMPSDNVYSIVQRKASGGYRGYAWNLFFAKRQHKELFIAGWDLTVLSFGAIITSVVVSFFHILK